MRGKIGIDEAGRGPLAGPVTAAAVLLPPKSSLEGLNDSKLLAPAVREELYGKIVSRALAFGCVSVGSRRVDTLNIRQATRLAMELSLLRLRRSFLSKFPGQEFSFKVFIDGNMEICTDLPQRTIIGGDGLEPCIMAASIIAKVSRDRIMRRLCEQYPGYEFAVHKGYGTEKHREKIRSLGPCAVHRRSFGGVKEYVALVSQQDSAPDYIEPLPPDRIAVGEDW